MRSSSTAIAGGIVIAIAAVAACSSFSAEDPTAAPTGEAGPDAPTLPDGAPPPVDASEGGPKLVAPLVVGSNFQNLQGIAATENAVYVVEQGTGRVLALPIAGGAPSEFAADPATTSPSGVVVLDSTVYWSDFGKKKLGSRQIGTGANNTTITLTNNLAPVAIAASSASPAQIVIAGIGAGSGTSEVQRYLVPPNVGETVQGMLLNIWDVATRGNLIYWTDSASGFVWGGSLDGLIASAPIATAESGCESIATDAEGVYWTRPAGGLVRWWAASAGTLDLVTGELNPFSLASDDSGVYWLTEDGKLRRSTRGELAPQTMAQGFAAQFATRYVQAIALTSKYVVWITTDGNVLRLDKT